MWEQEADIIPLATVITADQALSVADISPGISVKMNKGMFKVEKGKKKEGTLKNNTVTNVERRIIRCTFNIMLQRKLLGKPSIKSKRWSQRSFITAIGFSQDESFHNKWRSQVHL